MNALPAPAPFGHRRPYPCRRIRHKRRCGPALLAITLPTALVYAAPLSAASGISPLGTGAIQNGLAGAGTASAGDAFSVVRNPAAGAALTTQLAVSLDLALPNGRITAGASASDPGVFAFVPQTQRSVDGALPVPQFAYNQHLENGSAWGVSLSAAGLVAETPHGSALFAEHAFAPAIATDCAATVWAPCNCRCISCF